MSMNLSLQLQACILIEQLCGSSFSRCYKITINVIWISSDEPLDAPPDEPLGETNCCGFIVFNVYSVAVQIEM